jgi:hypothetical protein
MTYTVPKFAFAAIAYTAWCGAIHFLAAAAITLVFRSPDPTIAFPFANAHLLEEAVAGHYHPLTSAPVMIYTLVVCLVGFLFGAYICSRVLGRHKLYLSVLLPFLAMGAMAGILRFVFSSGYPAAMRTTAVVQLVLFLGLGLLGTRLHSLRASHAA